VLFGKDKITSKRLIIELHKYLSLLWWKNGDERDILHAPLGMNNYIRYIFKAYQTPFRKIFQYDLIFSQGGDD
jgi:hypothetical protein